jgi:hypothetical protein
MNEATFALLSALEGSAAAIAIRQSIWIYPAANVAHVMTLVVLAGAVAVMDLRLLGAFAPTRPVDVVRPARRVAILALVLMAASGLVLFTAEATHIAMNPVFQAKAALIALAIVNALILGRIPGKALEDMQPYESFAPRVRAAAAVSLALWTTVAGLGRFIAYL